MTLDALICRPLQRLEADLMAAGETGSAIRVVVAGDLYERLVEELGGWSEPLDRDDDGLFVGEHRLVKLCPTQASG